MQRDLIGYGQHIPKIIWPNQARLAINFVLNYEEGAESTILNGDLCSESYLVDLPTVIPLEGERHLSVESLFEYGSRTGIWRLLNLFDEQAISLTLFMTGMALEKNLPLAERLKNSTHEIAGHGYRWINYRTVSPVVEREHIQRTLEIIRVLTNKKIMGWYTGRRSIHTRQLLVEEGLQYDSDSYADDLPYWVNVNNRSHLIIPYQLDTNDARYATSPGWNTSDDFLNYLKASFDCLYREGASHPKMMTIGLHGRFSGRPGRCEAIVRFLKYIQQFDDVWICKREEIASYWYKEILIKDK